MNAVPNFEGGGCWPFIEVYHYSRSLRLVRVSLCFVSLSSSVYLTFLGSDMNSYILVLFDA